MGPKQSTQSRLPAISKQQWREIPLPQDTRWRVSHGRYRLLENILTSQRIEQYVLVFEGTDEYQQYLESFEWREREEYVAGTKYIEGGEESTFCGSRIRVTVYLPHTPHRLSHLTDIPIPENLYVLSAALSGFNKLYQLIGYFRPSEDMVGIDSDGRVRVWLNADFSKNYLYGPHYVQPTQDESLLNNEETMVRQVVAMVERNTSYEETNIAKFIDFLEQRNERISFRSALRAILIYARLHNMIIPRYFISLLGLHNHFSDGSQYQSSPRHSLDPLKVSQNNIRKYKSNKVYYIDPALNSSHANSTQPIHNEVERSIRQGQGDTTGETIIKNNIINSNSLSTAIRERSIPKIHFRYGNTQQDLSNTSNSHQQYLTPPHSQTTTLHQSLATPHFNLPLSLIAESKVLQSLGGTKRITFSDKHQEYFLDQEIVEDMAKYLK